VEFPCDVSDFDTAVLFDGFGGGRNFVWSACLLRASRDAHLGTAAQNDRGRQPIWRIEATPRPINHPSVSPVCNVGKDLRIFLAAGLRDRPMLKRGPRCVGIEEGSSGQRGGTNAIQVSTEAFF
jgi:hypothetical protein